MSAGRIVRVEDSDRGGREPRYLDPDYRSSVKRAPGRPLVLLPEALADPTGPVFGDAVEHVDLGIRSEERRVGKECRSR